MSKETAALWNAEIKQANPNTIIDFAFSHISGTLGLATSLSIEDQMLTHLLQAYKANIKFFTLDTGRLFQETFDTIEKTNEHFGIKIEVCFPDQNAVLNMVNSKGVNSFYQSIENRKQCCQIRKTDPLNKALVGLAGWFTGLRRSQAVTRIALPVIEWDEIHQMYKINPLADLTEEEVLDWNKLHSVPVNPIQEKGFRSIGCLPCTRAIGPDDDVRAGRWWWEQADSKECGLHVKK